MKINIYTATYRFARVEGVATYEMAADPVGHAIGAASFGAAYSLASTDVAEVVADEFFNNGRVAGRDIAMLVGLVLQHEGVTLGRTE